MGNFPKKYIIHKNRQPDKILVPLIEDDKADERDHDLQELERVTEFMHKEKTYEVGQM